MGQEQVDSSILTRPQCNLISFNTSICMCYSFSLMPLMRRGGSQWITFNDQVSSLGVGRQSDGQACPPILRPPQEKPISLVYCRECRHRLMMITLFLLNHD